MSHPPSLIAFRPARRRALAHAAAAAGAALLLAACGRGGPPGAGAPGGAAPVSVVPAVEREVAEQQDYTGRLEAVQTVAVRARVGGPIDQVHFRDGATVKAGQLLYTLDRRPYAAEVARAESQAAAARAQAELARADLARVQPLIEARAIARQELDQLAATAARSAADLKAAEAALRSARLNLEFTEVRAPIAGQLSRAEITVGNLVSPEQVLTTLVDASRVYAYFEVHEQAFLRLRGLAGQGLSVQMGLAHESGLPHAGRVDFVDNQLNPATGAIRMRASFDNREARFAPGLFARLQLGGGTPRRVVMVPDRALGTDQSKKFVYVVGEGQTAQPREVRPGALREGMRVIEQGLAAGDKVIVSGLQRVRPGVPLAPTELPVDAQGLPVEPAAAPSPGAPSAPAPAASAASGASR